jgi:hypothetical protein
MKIKIKNEMLKSKGMIYKRGFNIIITFVNDFEL